MTQAGRRKERVTLQARGPDANGDALGDWMAGSAFWARVRPLKGSEPVMQQRLQGIQPVEITVLSCAFTRDVTSAWRAVWKGQAYNIRAVTPGEGRDEIALLAERDQSDA